MKVKVPNMDLDINHNLEILKEEMKKKTRGIEFLQWLLTRVIIVNM